MLMLKKIVKKMLRYLKFPLVALDFFRFKDLSVKAGRRRPLLRDVYPCPLDRTVKTGFDRHYVYHTSWAARILADVKPDKHVDVSSSLYFVGIISAFLPVEHYDYRPADLELDGLICREGDLNNLPQADNSVTSLSCMHVIEHVGLGRYGDVLDPDGDASAAAELTRVLAPGGSLLVVLPVGRSGVHFNAHRVYSLEAALELFPGLKLQEFSLLPESAGGFIKNADSQRVAKESYGCGCFWFTKEV